MKVEVVLTEADLAQEFTDAFEARDLPEKFFYWFPRSAADWTVLAADPDLYGGLAATWKELGAGAMELASHFQGRVPVISFGAGDGARDGLLLGALKDSGCECLYFPVDSSQGLLELASAKAEDNDIETTCIKADISSPVHLVYAADAADPPRLFVLSGNTISSLDPLAEIRYVAQCMKPGDRLIVDGEIHHAEQTMERNTRPAVRNFLWAVLESVGIQQANGEIRFNQKHDERHEGLHLITRYFRAETDLAATVVSQNIALQRGERIGLNFQYAYSPDAFRWLLTEHGGLDLVRVHLSPDGRFLTAICKK
jgi:uncharacterized SAM-dependent methyltransferase